MESPTAVDYHGRCPHGAPRLSAIDTDPESHPVPAGTVASNELPISEEIHGYDRIFWLAYLANGLATMANSMLVRYADFVEVLGGEERQLGLIVGCGMIGSIAIRLAQGVAIDHYGASKVWRWSIAIYTLSLFLHLLVSTAYGPGIFLARMLLQASIAGFFGSSITFVSLRVPPQRMAEIVGVLGTSGFIGIMAGPLLSDWLAAGAAPVAGVERMFQTCGLLSVGSLLVTIYLTRHSAAPRHRRRPPLIPIVRRYMPAMISIMAAAMGAGFTIPMTFLRPFTEEIRLNGVGFFFMAYASIAFAARVATRSHFSRLGNRLWIIIGMTLLSVSFICYLPVSRIWQFVFPAATAGIAHALLFPSIMSAGTSAFPRRYLGVATSLMLAMLDLGAFLGAPIVGAFLREAKQHTNFAYPLMFSGVATTLAVVTVIFCCSQAARRQ